LVDVLEIQTGDDTAEEAAREGLGEASDFCRWRFDATLREHKRFFGDPLDFGFPPDLFFGGNIGGMRQDLRDARVPFVRELRQKRVTDAIARKTQIAIAGILAPGDAARAQVLLDFGAGDSKQRAN
jgi:hypothetical protein